MARITKFTTNAVTGAITISQGSEEYNDCRVWRLGSGNHFRFSNTNTLLYLDTDNSLIFEKPISATFTGKPTLCIDRGEINCYIWYCEGGSYAIKVLKVNIATGSQLLYEPTQGLGTPLKVTCDRLGRFWALASNQREEIHLYDENINYVASSNAGFSSSKGSINTMVLTEDIECYTWESTIINAGLNKFTENLGVISREVGSNSPIDNNSKAVDMFSLEGYIYTLNGAFNRTVNLCKIPIATALNGNTWSTKDITTIYGVSRDDITQFSTDGFNNNGNTYARFYENNGSDRRITWQVNLSDHSLLPLRWTDETRTESIFSDDTNLDIVISDIAIGSDNCDPPGLTTSEKGPTREF